MNRKKEQQHHRQERQATLEAYQINFVGISAEAEKLRRRLRISRREWKKIR